MSAGAVIAIVVASVVVVVAVLALVLRGNTEMEGSSPSGWKAKLRAGRGPKPIPAPAATVERVKGRNVITTSTGPASVADVDATGDVTTRAGDAPGAGNPKA